MRRILAFLLTVISVVSAIGFYAEAICNVAASDGAEVGRESFATVSDGAEVGREGFATVSDGAEAGVGIEVVARDTFAIKSGKSGEKIKLSAEDFKAALSVVDFDSITVTRLPRSEDGVLLQAGRRVKEGQTLKKRALSTFIFVPKDRSVTDADFEFVMNGAGAGEKTLFRLRFIDGGNNAPVIPESEAVALRLNTQAGIGIYGRLSGFDPDGDKIEFIAVGFPRRGAIVITDRETGEYEYTPMGDFIGTDSFKYVVRDEYGNFSEVKEVRVTVGERLSPIVLSDMHKRSEEGAAVAMCALGIMGAEERGGIYYFSPNERVTRAEFVMMAMKACGIQPTGEGEPFFDDSGDIQEAMRGYITVAAYQGIVDGDFGASGLVFRPNDSITRTEAAIIMARLLNLSTGVEEEVFAPLDGVEVWATGQVHATITLGIFDVCENGFRGGDPMSRAEAAECLYRLIKVK